MKHREDRGQKFSVASILAPIGRVADVYLDFYHLSKGPFRITPDPEFLFLSPTHQVALDTITYGIEDRKGFIVICGEVGLGKTTILRSYLTRTDPKQLKTIYIVNPNISFAGLLKAIYREFALSIPTDNLLEQVTHLYNYLFEEYYAGRNVVLLIDDAQNMPIETLASLRMLSNLETTTDKLLQIVLVGQPELEQKLNLPELQQVQQRIAIHTTIAPLTLAQSKAYIQHRLAKVLTKREAIFTPGAIKLLAKQARGVPRALNILCDNALIAGFSARQKPVTTTLVKEVITTFQGKPKYRVWRWGFAGVISLLLLGGLLWLSLYRNGEGAKRESLGWSSLLQSVSGDSSLSKVLTTVKGWFQRDQEAKEQKEHVGAVPPGQERIVPQKQTSPPVSRGISDMDKPKSVSTPMPEVVSQTQRTSAEIPVSESALVSQEQVRTRLEDQTEGSPTTLSQRPFPEALPETSRKTTRLSPQTFPVTRVVKEGDSLWKLAMEIYGVGNNNVIKWVKEHNPHIRDVHTINIGETILFPALPE